MEGERQAAGEGERSPAGFAGCFDDFHRQILELLWNQYKFLSGQIERVEAKTRNEVEPHRELIQLSDGVPGMDEMVAWTLIAEMGTDMDVFPTAAHAAGWVGMCPGTNESTGKQMSTKTRKLLQIAYGIMKTRTPYHELGSDYYDQLNPEKTIQRLVRRLGKLGVEVT